VSLSRTARKIVLPRSPISLAPPRCGRSRRVRCGHSDIRRQPAASRSHLESGNPGLFPGTTFRGGLGKVRFTGQQRRIPPRTVSGPHCSRPLRGQDGVNIYETRRLEQPSSIEQPSSHRIKPRDTALHCRIVPVRGAPTSAPRTVRVYLPCTSRPRALERILVEPKPSRSPLTSKRVNTFLTSDSVGSLEKFFGSVST